MAEVEVTARTCFVCHVSKPLEEFHRSKNMPLGHSYECKACAKIRQTGRINRAPHSETTILLNRERSRQAYVSKPEATVARAMIARLVNLGLIERQACQYPLCHKEKTDGHHPSYEEPLEVIWLCRSHHWLAERILKGSGETMPALFIHSYESVAKAVASC